MSLKNGQVCSSFFWQYIVGFSIEMLKKALITCSSVMPADEVYFMPVASLHKSFSTFTSSGYSFQVGSKEHTAVLLAQTELNFQ